MLPRQLIAEAVTATAVRLEGGYATDVKRREDRLRQALLASLEEQEQVLEVRTSPEWRPEMPFWPWSADGKKKLGGFDCAIRFVGDDSYSLVIELKWTHHGYVNALDEAIWDALKLAQASATLPGVTHGLLVYLAPLKAWNTPPRFGELFDECFASTRSLLSNHEAIWRWCLETGSAARPTKLPPFLQTSPIAAAALTLNGEAWELRAALARANGEPWIDLDPDGFPIPDASPSVFEWPYPEPGPGMVTEDHAHEFEWPTFDVPQTESGLLTPGDVPGPNATWSEICFFAAHFNGYERFGDFDEGGVGELANAARKYFDDYLDVDRSLDLDQLRGCLFFEYRRFHHFSHAPGAADTPYLRSLVEAIRARVDTLP